MNPAAMPVAELSSAEIIQAYAHLLDVSNYFLGIERMSLLVDKSGLMQWSPTIVADSDFYEKLNSKVLSYYPRSKREYVEAASIIGEVDSVLEIGCGEGYFASFFSPKNWFGVDINTSALLRVRDKGFRCQEWDLTKDSLAKLKAPKPNVICSFQTLEHMSDPALLFKVAHQLLDFNEMLLIGVPSHDSLLGMHPLGALNLPPHHQTWWPDKALKEYPLQFGFKCEEIIHCQVDSFHNKWFLETLLGHMSDKKAKKYPPLKRKIYRIICNALVNSLVSSFVSEDEVIDPRFGLRGQSVLAIYRKVELRSL